RRMEAPEPQSRRLGGNDAGGSAVAPDEKAQHLVDFRAFLEMKRAELDADDGALDIGAQPETCHDLEVEPRGVEAGAGDDDEMRDLVLDVDEAGIVKRGGGKLRRMLLEKPHPHTGVGKLAWPIETAAVEVRPVGLRFQMRVAVLDLRFFDEPEI